MNSQIEFIEFNLIIFCDGIRTYIHTLWLLESLDLSDRETKNLSMHLHHHRTNSHQSSSVLGGLKLGSHSCKIMLIKMGVFSKLRLSIDNWYSVRYALS